MNTDLALLFLQNPSVDCVQVSDETWQTGAEIEGILSIVSQVTTLVQHERACTGGFKSILYQHAQDALDEVMGSVPAIDLEAPFAPEKTRKPVRVAMV